MHCRCEVRGGFAERKVEGGERDLRAREEGSGESDELHDGGLCRGEVQVRDFLSWEMFCGEGECRWMSFSKRVEEDVKNLFI